MSDVTAPQAPVSGKATGKPVSKPVGSKPVGKPVNKAPGKVTKGPAAPAKDETPKEPGEYGIDRTSDLPWGTKKLEVFKALKALKAVGISGAKSTTEIVAKGNGAITPRDVRHYVYHAKAAGLADIAKQPGVAGYSFYLTAKGAALDLVKIQKEVATAKKDKAAAE